MASYTGGSTTTPPTTPSSGEESEPTPVDTPEGPSATDGAAADAAPFYEEPVYK